jgi:bifunctional enzyme CysN/CysC
MNKEAFSLEAVSAAGTADTLRLLTCGSVDDGKSTLIGRLLYDSHLLMEDQIEDLQRDSKKHGTAGDEMDFALLVDGLEAEREQGITIDVAYRFFATPRRRFIVADTPGHVQYTRNMATGASTADLAILLVDATKGPAHPDPAARVIVSLLGIRHVVLAVNKMDLVDFDEATFAPSSRISSFRRKLASRDHRDPDVGPRRRQRFDAERADALVSRSLTSCSTWRASSWRAAPPPAVPASRPVGLPARTRISAASPARSFPGGSQGREVVVAASGRSSRMPASSSARKSARRRWRRGLMVTLADEIDASRGDVLVSKDARPQVSDQFAAHLIWMDPEHLLPGRQYLLKNATRTVPVQVTELKYRLDVDSLEHIAEKVLEVNEVGRRQSSTAEPIAIDPYAENP